MEGGEKKQQQQQQPNLLLRAKGLHQKGQMNSLKSSTNDYFINFVIINQTH